jgi:hypothetical protein
MAPIIVDGLLRGCLDVFGRIEIGFSEAKVDNVNAFCSQLSAQLGHFQGLRLSKPGKKG